MKQFVIASMKKSAFAFAAFAAALSNAAALQPFLVPFHSDYLPGVCRRLLDNERTYKYAREPWPKDRLLIGKLLSKCGAAGCMECERDTGCTYTVWNCREVFESAVCLTAEWMMRPHNKDRGLPQWAHVHWIGSGTEHVECEWKDDEQLMQVCVSCDEFSGKCTYDSEECLKQSLCDEASKVDSETGVYYKPVRRLWLKYWHYFEDTVTCSVSKYWEKCYRCNRNSMRCDRLVCGKDKDTFFQIV